MSQPWTFFKLYVWTKKSNMILDVIILLFWIECFLLQKVINGVALIHTGPVELAAVGVSIALFNQVSRIAIFPLVSVTTSFVAEEDAIGSVSHEAQDCEHLETGSTTNGEDKELIPKNGILSFFSHISLFKHF